MNEPLDRVCWTLVITHAFFFSINDFVLILLSLRFFSSLLSLLIFSHNILNCIGYPKVVNPSIFIYY